MNSQLDHAKGLLSKAHDDFFVVCRLAGEADAPGWVLGFHAEQAAIVGCIPCTKHSKPTACNVGQQGIS